jgi:hypothetical protein
MGNVPIAVSPDSITALVPSKIALATSDTSARVGLGLLIIDSSICVAVMTGFPTALALRMICFCSRDLVQRHLDLVTRATIRPSAAAKYPGLNRLGFDPGNDPSSAA